MEKKYAIKVLEKLFNILDLFDETGKHLSAAEINDSLGFKKVSTFRILKNLENAGYLERDSETFKYSLGWKIYCFGLLVQPYNKIRQITRPFLEKLNTRSHETVHLAILDRGETLYLDKIEGDTTIRVITRIGRKLPAHCSGVGKILLAGLSKKTLMEVLKVKGLPMLTKNTITTFELLCDELANIRKQNYAIDNEETEEGLKCVSAPLRDSEDKVIAAISISAPKDRFDKQISTYIAEVTETSKKISTHLYQQGIKKHRSLEI